MEERTMEDDEGVSFDYFEAETLDAESYPVTLNVWGTITHFFGEGGVY
jgi:hypothetical protein